MFQLEDEASLRSDHELRMIADEEREAKKKAGDSDSAEVILGLVYTT